MIGKLSISPWGKTAQRALVWAYDCFPFGMLMPGRYISDTSDHCMTISRSNWSTEMADTCKPLATLASTGIFSAGSSISTSGSSIVLHAEEYDSWIQLTTEVEAGIDNSFTFSVSVLEGAEESGMQVMIIETRDNTPYVIGGGYLMPGGRKQTISFNASGNTVNLLFNGPFSTAEIEQICTHYTKTTQQTYLVEVCDESKDKYRYGFGGHEKDDEVAGSGNYYGFGDYGLDVRLGRRWRVDPKAAKYPMWSPYVFCADNPIRYIDPDGQEFVDPNGKRVAITYLKDGSLKFSKNATPDIIRAANALNLTSAGKTELRKIDQSDIKVKLNITSDSKIEKRPDGSTSYTYGEAIQGNYNKNDNYGRKVNADGTYGIKEATITIYEGTIAEGIKDGSGLKHEGLTLEQAIGAVVGHEGVHATDKVEIDKDLKAEMKGKSHTERETKPNRVEQKIIDQSKKLNEQQ